MPIEIDEKQHTIKKLEKHLKEIELEQENGAKYFTVDDLDAALKKIVDKE